MGEMILLIGGGAVFVTGIALMAVLGQMNQRSVTNEREQYLDEIDYMADWSGHL